jgi:6-phosphogluconate dehydrogenase
MKLILVGLGKMGGQIAKRLIDSGHEVVAVDPNPAAVTAAAEFGAITSTSRIDAISKFNGERVVVWLMIPAAYVNEEISEWCNVLPADAVLIDGGNTDFRKTKKHAALAEGKNVRFLDIGVSGGVMGLANGFSMMAGGDEQAYQLIVPILDALSAPRGGHDYFGEVGSGHYIKMVHNAIEYGMMEALAEGYRMLREGPYKDLDLAKAGEVWQKASVIESTLNKLATEIMHEDKTLANASGYVAESGEARWTLEEAEHAHITLPAIQAAFDVRLASEHGDVSYTTKLLAELRNKFGGHPLNTNG